MLKKTLFFLVRFILSLTLLPINVSAVSPMNMELLFNEKSGGNGFYITADISSQQNIGVVYVFIGIDKSSAELKNITIPDKSQNEMLQYNDTEKGVQFIYMTKDTDVHDFSVRLNFDFVSGDKNIMASGTILQAFDYDGNEIDVGETVFADMSSSEKKTQENSKTQNSKSSDMEKLIPETSLKSIPKLQSNIIPEISYPQSKEETTSEEPEQIISIQGSKEENGTSKEMLILGAGAIISCAAIGIALILKNKNKN